MSKLVLTLLILVLAGSVALAKQEIPVFPVVNGVPDTANPTALARAWKAGQYQYYCNADREIVVAVNCSLAQWMDLSLEATRLYWRILKPGDYAVNGIGVQLRSNGDVAVDYEGFADLQNSDVPKDKIPTYYAVTVGGTVPGAGDWVTAADLNDDDDLIVEDEDHEAISFAIWNRLVPFECDSACEYMDCARIYVTLDEQKPWVDPETGDFDPDFPAPPPWPGITPFVP